MSKSERRIDIEEISGVTVARLLEKKILDAFLTEIKRIGGEHNVRSTATQAEESDV